MTLAARFALGLFVVAGTLGSLSAQHPTSVWAGEWGQFQRIQLAGAQYEGAALSVTDCVGQHCTFTLQVKGSKSHGDGSGDLQIESDREAVAHLKVSGNYKCSPLLEMTGTADPVITVKSQDEGCSDFCTPGASFVHSYPLHSRAAFFGSDIAACYAAPGPAQTALCASQPLSQQENQWMRLEWEVMNLGTPALNEKTDRQNMLDDCDGSSKPAGCLANTFQQSMQKLDERKSAWQRDVTEPGNVQEAARKIASVSGYYRHSFKNGDVQGDTFQSTNKLWISKASDHAIRYLVNLEFYNGHSCSRSGEASYKRGGMFVDQEQDASGKMCVFELIPTASGLQLGDPTGVCRMSDCGARGGYGGAFFPFTDRSHPKRFH